MQVTINEAQRLFVIPSGTGFSCMGFDNVYRHLLEALARLGRNDERADQSKIGTLEQYEAYRESLGEAAKKGGFKDTWFDSLTPEAVRKVLERARKSGQTLRLFLGDPQTGRDWAGEFELIGKIRRSGGITKVPLLLSDGENFGGAILDACILKIMSVPDGEVLYQHELYQEPSFEIHELISPIDHGPKRYTHEVRREGKEVARFTSHGKAAHYVAFMHGESFRQPQ